MKAYLILAAITVVTLAGDYLIKSASAKEFGLTTPTFLVGMVLYGVPAIGWFFLMRSHSLAAVGVLYSASTMLLLAGLGYFVFKEAFGMREVVGLTLAIGSVVVMSYEG